MLGQAAMKKNNSDATAKARKVSRKPLVFWNVDTVEKELPYLPFLGNFVHKDFQVIEDESMFVDISGFGQAEESALTYPECKAEIKRLIAEHAGETIGFAFVELGQFQGCVQVYRYIGTYDLVDPLTDCTPFIKP